MNEVIVSIIIPCYNVGKYIEKCIASLCEQSHKNIEIIPVNDGSKDETLNILLSLEKKDNRIKITNKENAGVSAARNSGLEVATGEYVVFVDGDDYLAPDYVEYMLSLAKKSDADFCMSKNCFYRDTEPQVEHDNIQIMTPAQATALLISPRVIVGCWNKMFKRSFINKYRLSFSTNLFYGEGLNFITKASQLANNVAVGERKVYYYRRNNEASATSKYNIQKYYNGEKALDKIKQELVVHDKDVDLMMALHKSLFCTGALSQTYAHGLQKQYAEDCNHWRKIIKDNLWVLLKSKKVSIYRKVLLMSVCCFPGLVSKLDMWRRKRIAERSVC